MLLPLLLPCGELRAAGLRTHFVRVRLENLKIGKSYSLRKERNLPLSITNASRSRAYLKIEALSPQPHEMISGFEPIPALSWIGFEHDLLTLEPESTGQTDIIISVPDNTQYLGKRYQVMIFSRTISGMFGAGFKSRLLFSIDAAR